MKIGEMFERQIDRDLQGVITVGEEQGVDEAQELEEYVVTRELQKYFADFFAAYKKGIVGNTTKTGVWISGFFGSGKSHFLKIISYILENKEVGGKKAIDYFTEGEKIKDPMVLADMKLAAETPADVILFNIDSKADSTSKQNKDAIVNVFLKVFNEMQGFCGAMPHLADLEKRLSDEGKFDEFRQKFEADYGDKWEDSRQDFDFIQDTVVDVLSEMGFMSEEAARNWCEKAITPYSISIEDFAKRVKDYIEKKGNNHHVVFLADEIGQYIGDDSTLMLNLQTVREDLGRECNGKAWVVVTSQQDIDSVVHVKGNDFSKIQGRFDTRIALSAANVDEVIKERILKKKEPATEALSALYEQKATIIKNLIIFNDSVEKRLYENDRDFSAVYPFVPYHFDLLGSVLTSIRTHGASGKHLSEGARSMLALFKESAAKIKDREMGAIVPFHRFYDALENFLDHSHRDVITRAYENTKINPDRKDSDVFAINVLKTLFMIKYVVEITSSVENLTSLMVENIDDDRVALRAKVEDALKVLCQQMLVQKNGENYIFLTDEEQEINREIDGQNAEMAETINKASEMVFEDIFSDKKYKPNLLNGRYAFGFNQIMDDRQYKSNQSYDIGLRILTPWYDGGKDEGTLRLKSGQGREVLVVLPEDRTFLEEIQQALKIEKFLRLNSSSKLAKYETIKEGKRVEMRDRLANAKLYLTENLKDATIYVNGDIAQLQSKDVVGRINEALGRLVITVYNKLDYIEAAFGEADIRKLLTETNQISLDTENQGEPNAHALKEVLDYIQMNSGMHIKTSMKTLKDKFMKAPYGYVEDDIHYLVARLFKKGDLSFTMSGTPVTLQNKTVEEIIGFITKKAYVDKLFMEVREHVSEKDKKAVKDVMKELFHTPASGDDEDAVMDQFKHYANDMLNDIGKLEVYYKSYAYPGAKVLARGKELLQRTVNYDSAQEFYTEISKNRDDYYEFADDYQPVKDFFSGTQRLIYDKTVAVMEIYEDSKTYVVNKDLEAIVDEIRTILAKESPYQDIPNLPGLREKFTDAYNQILDEQMKPVLDSIEQDKNRTLKVLDSKKYKDEKLQMINDAFYEIEEGAKSCNNISRLRSYADKANALKIRLLNEMAELDQKIFEEEHKHDDPVVPDGGDRPETVPVNVPHVKSITNIDIKSVASVSSWQLESEADIDKCLAELKKNLLAKLEADTILNVEI